VTVWYSAPTAIRLLMRDGEAVVKQHSLATLRHLISVGEPLAAEAVTCPSACSASRSTIRIGRPRPGAS